MTDLTIIKANIEINKSKNNKFIILIPADKIRKKGLKNNKIAIKLNMRIIILFKNLTDIINKLFISSYKILFKHMSENYVFLNILITPDTTGF
jgi:hypothetical protein